MPNIQLAYNPTAGGSGVGFAAWSPSSNFAIPSGPWRSDAGGFAWWMSPTYIPGTFGMIGRIDTTEAQPVGPWTWNSTVVTNPATWPSSSIGSNNGRFNVSTSIIYISANTYTGIFNGIGDALNGLGTLPFNIYVRGVGLTAPTFTVFTLTGIALNVNPGVHRLSVTYVSGDQPVISDDNLYAISTRDNPIPKENRSRGTMSFFGADEGNGDIARLGVKLGIPGVTIASTDTQVRTAAQATANFWTSF